MVHFIISKAVGVTALSSCWNRNHYQFYIAGVWREKKLNSSLTSKSKWYSTHCAYTPTTLEYEFPAENWWSSSVFLGISYTLFITLPTVLLFQSVVPGNFCLIHVYLKISNWFYSRPFCKVPEDVGKVLSVVEMALYIFESMTFTDLPCTAVKMKK